MKQLPNILSVTRILISFALILLIDSPTWFIFGYLVCGISDVADGFFARRFHATSKLGAFLDSLSNLIFWTIILYLAIIYIQFQPYIIYVMILVCCLRLFNLIFTKYKFNTLSMMHTIMNKLTGVLIFILLPVCFVVGYVPIWVAVLVLAVALTSAIEEFIICVLISDYDANLKSIIQAQNLLN